MSKKMLLQLKCPHCGYRQDTFAWTSINVTVNPELKEKLFDGEINMLTCEKCNEKTFINTPLLYHDMEQRYCVQYYPSESIEDDDFFDKFTPDGKLLMSPGIPEEHLKLADHIATPHIVFYIGEMLCYIIFRDKLKEAKA
jgi:hypothetical protein